MRILYINSVCRSGSTGKITYDLFSEVINENHEAIICYGRGKRIPESGLVKFSYDMETYIHAFLTRVTGFTGCFSFFSTRNLLRILKEFRPDVVHIHEMHAYFINISPIMEFLKRNGIRTIWTFHCEFMYTGRCGYSYECNRWESTCGQCPKIVEYPKTFLFDWSRYMRRKKQKLFSDFEKLTIVTPSEWLKDRVEKSFLMGKDVRVIRNGIEARGVFYPRDYTELKAKHGLTNERVILAVAPGIMQDRKGGEWILKLSELMISDNVKIIMIGVEEPLEIQRSNVIALGRTENQEELATYYSMADVFVICSRIENYPTVCLEALCCGTPVCGFDVGGTKEAAPEDLGIFVEYGDVRALKTAVTSMLDGPDRTEQCRKYALDVHCKERMYKEYRKLYFSNNA